MRVCVKAGIGIVVVSAISLLIMTFVANIILESTLEGKITHEELKTLRFYVLPIGFGGAFILIAIGGLLWTHLSIRPLVRLSRQTRAVVDGGLRRRVEVKPGSGEVVEIANSFNTILDLYADKQKTLASLDSDLHELFISIIKTLVITLEAKDQYTKGHSERVTKYSVMLAKGFIRYHEDKERFMTNLEYAAILHDIGKIGTSELLLHKPGRLTEAEFEVIKQHPVLGAQIIKQIKFLRDASTIVRHHHERYDGLGYPLGLKGAGIPLGSRIIAVADTFDAMTSDRPYRPRLTKGEAIHEILTNKRTQFDPEIADFFVRKICPSIELD